MTLMTIHNDDGTDDMFNVTINTLDGGPRELTEDDISFVRRVFEISMGIREVPPAESVMDALSAFGYRFEAAEPEFSVRVRRA